MNKSAVCRIVNRISRDVSRHDAFVQAWAIVKAGGLDLAVRGGASGLPALRVVAGSWDWANKTTFGARLALAV